MEKKVDLTENNKTSTIRLKSNKSISLTINIQKRPPRDLSTDSQFKINRGRIHRLTQYNNYTNEIPNEEDDEIPEDYFDDEETNDGSDGENSISDDLKDELKQRAQEKLKEKLKNRTKKKANNQPRKPATPKGTPPTSTTGTTLTTGGTATTATGGTAVATGGTATAAGGTAAATGTALAAPEIAVVVVIILVILLIIILIVVLIGAATGAAEEAAGNYFYGTTCTSVTVENTPNPADVGTVSFDDYIAGVVAAEVGNTNDIELYKTAAIASRTYVFENIDSSCIVEGNSSFKEYVDIESHPSKDIIRQAVQETKNIVLTENSDLVNIKYDYGYIEKEDSNNYYIGYGYNDLDGPKIQTIPKNWVKNIGYEDKLKTSSNNYDMSIIGAMYLSAQQNYSSDNILKYYYGNEVEIIENTMILAGVNGFVNPTREINCTSPFGTRIHPINKTEDFHDGLDIGISGGEPIFATKDGVVTVAVNNVIQINDCSYGYGNYVIIDHGDGTQTLYSHMKYGSIPSDIYVGAAVFQGQQIGEVGSTGCSTGNHLHYEVRLNGERVDPADYLDLTYATGNCRN